MFKESRPFTLVVIIIVAITLLFAGLIVANLMHTQWTKELLQLSLEKGQNPMYVKCAMESNPSNECKTLVTALAVGRSDK